MVVRGLVLDWFGGGFCVRKNGKKGPRKNCGIKWREMTNGILRKKVNGSFVGKKN
jgi:hypothetical protein